MVTKGCPVPLNISSPSIKTPFPEVVAAPIWKGDIEASKGLSNLVNDLT